VVLSYLRQYSQRPPPPLLLLFLVTLLLLLLSAVLIPRSSKGPLSLCTIDWFVIIINITLAPPTSLAAYSIQYHQYLALNSACAPPLPPANLHWHGPHSVVPTIFLHCIRTATRPRDLWHHPGAPRATAPQLKRGEAEDYADHMRGPVRQICCTFSSSNLCSIKRVCVNIPSREKCSTHKTFGTYGHNFIFFLGALLISSASLRFLPLRLL